MLVYRVVPHLPGALEGDPGSPLYVHPGQGRSRLDNPSHYRVWYFASEASGAIGETFGNLSRWSEEMFLFPGLADSRRALVTYLLPEETPLLDLDDAKTLLVRGLKPTQVTERNRAATQAWALNIFLERNNRGERRWDGIRWWSFHHSQWRIIGYWNESPPKVLNVESLSLSHPAVVDAAMTLRRPPIAEEPSWDELSTASGVAVGPEQAVHP